MTYYDKRRRQVVIEVFSSIGAVRDKLTAAGYKFTESDIYSNQFWGKAFRIDRPTGKNATAKMNFLMNEAAR